MRNAAAVLVAALVAACASAESAPPPVPRDAPREATFEVTYLDTIDGNPANHVAVGGRMRIKVPQGPATWTAVAGPFQIVESSFDTFVITALDSGTGQIEIETATGLARFKLTAAPIAKIEMRDVSLTSAEVALLDASGKRLVDGSLRLSGGSAPVTFNGAWDRIELGSLALGKHDIFVKTDTTAPARVTFDKQDEHSCIASIAMRASSMRTRSASRIAGR